MAVDGKYNITLNTPMGARPATLTLATDGSALTGAFSGEGGEQPLNTGEVSGDEVKFSTMFNGAMGPMKLDFAGKVDGDAISGSVQFGAFGAGTWEGKRA